MIPVSRRRFSRHMAAAALLAALFPASFGVQRAVAAPAAAGTCQMGTAAGPVQHVIAIQFDNLHLTRDNPNVPSDLEQIPSLLNFMKNNGVLLSQEHTPLIAHTADDIVTSLTGLYPDQQGIAVANGFRYFNADGSTSGTGAFGYWTDRLPGPTDRSYLMTTAQGTNTPAPWVPFTRAGCDVGAFSTANLEFENIGNDITTVFGANSPQAAEAKSNPNQATADFMGVAVHCAQNSPICSQANGGMADVLPDEPGGYSGYNALYGYKYVQPVISPGGPVTDLNGQVEKNENSGLVGFTGFDPTASQSLAMVADMQEHGIPVTYAYIADAHDPHPSGHAYGPGEAPYEAALKSYDQAFSAFFQRLARDGITPANSVFIITADENDHFVGGPPSPANCDGVTVPCTYDKVGEVDTNLAALLTDKGVKTPFTVHTDSAPTVYVTGQPGQSDPAVRTLEQTLPSVTAVSPYTGTAQPVMNYEAGPNEMALLHMVTGDPLRTPTLTMFGNVNNVFCAGGGGCPSSAPYTGLDTSAWNHGDVSPDINTTWLGIAGPGVSARGLDQTTWADETDIRPTLMALTGLKDDCQHEGRALFEIMDPAVLPAAAAAERTTLTSLAQIYKQLNAPVGQLGLDSLRVSTAALTSTDPVTYSLLDGSIGTIAAQRNVLAGQIAAALDAATFNGQWIDPNQAAIWMHDAQQYIDVMHLIAQTYGK